MTEKDENRVHYLLDCCDVNGHIDISAEDMALILRYQRELGKTDERTDIIEEVDIHLREAGYTYDSNMGLGDNIGSALLKEYANGYKKGEQDSGADERKKFAEWLEDKDYLWHFVTASTIIEEYEKELKREQA